MVLYVPVKINKKKGQIGMQCAGPHNFAIFAYFRARDSSQIMFILFFGTRSGTSRTQPLAGVRCSYCGNRNTLIATITPQYFHLFWLPLFTVSTLRRVTCTHCKRTYYKEDFTKEMEQAMGL